MKQNHWPSTGLRTKVGTAFRRGKITLEEVDALLAIELKFLERHIVILRHFSDDLHKEAAQREEESKNVEVA